MTPVIEAAARAPVSIEAPAGISENVWRRTAAAGSRVEVGTVFVVGESRREALGAPRSNDVYRREAVLQRLASLLRLAPGWDSYGAPGISPRAAELALKFLAFSTKGPTPSVVPTAKGGVQIEWHHGDVDLEIECFPSEHAHLFAQDMASGDAADRWVVPGHPAVDLWIRRVGTQR